MFDYDGLRTLTVEKAAEILGVHGETIRRWAREGRLRAARWGGRLHFAAEAVREFQAACQVLVPDPTEFIRQRRRGKARSGGRRSHGTAAGHGTSRTRARAAVPGRTAKSRRPLPGRSGRATAGAVAQPGQTAAAVQPSGAAQPLHERPGGSAPAEVPAAGGR